MCILPEHVSNQIYQQDYTPHVSPLPLVFTERWPIILEKYSQIQHYFLLRLLHV